MKDTKLCAGGCQQTLPSTSEFFAKNKHQTDGLQSACKTCQKTYREKNKDKLKAYAKEYREDIENKEKAKIYQQEYQDNFSADKKASELSRKIQYKQNNPDKVKESAALYRQTHKDQIRQYDKEYVKQKYHADPAFRLRNRVSAQIREMIKSQGSSKNQRSCLDYLPFTIPQLKDHLESQFEPWMTWDNQGKYMVKNWNDEDQSTWVWQIDHIKPQSDLPYQSMEDENFKKVWSLDNLRPLAAKENLLDGANRVRHH
jgi:hypothetical protein